MKLLLSGIVLLCLFLAFGCASMYLGSTEVSFKEGEWKYSSNKNQQDLAAEIGTDKQGKPFAKIQTTSVTPDAAMASALKAQLLYGQIIQDLIRSGGMAATMP